MSSCIAYDIIVRHERKRDFADKSWYAKFRLLAGRRRVPCVQTDGNDEDEFRFLQLVCQRA
jgi:hypothetical protein